MSGEKKTSSQRRGLEIGDVRWMGRRGGEGRKEGRRATMKEGWYYFRPSHVRSCSSDFSRGGLRDRETRHAGFLQRPVSLQVQWELMEGPRVSVLASFILWEWLSSVANLGFPPSEERRGEGRGSRLRHK